MLKTIIILILVGGALSLLIYLFQERLIFFPQKITGPKPEAFAQDEITLIHDGIRLHGWFIRAKASPPSALLVYYGGNAEEVSGNLYDFNRFPSVSVLLVNYRGYGMSSGRPAEAALFGDAVFILDTIVQREHIDPQRIVLLGRSLGSAVAVHVASQRQVGGLILVTPFDSLVHVAKKHYPFLPVRLLLKHRFNSAALAPRIAAPMLGIIAGNDEIIPRQSSQRLMQKWGGPSQAITIPAATHNDIQLHEAYWRAIKDFIASLAF